MLPTTKSAAMLKTILKGVKDGTPRYSRQAESETRLFYQPVVFRETSWNLRQAENEASARKTDRWQHNTQIVTAGLLGQELRDGLINLDRTGF